MRAAEGAPRLICERVAWGREATERDAASRRGLEQLADGGLERGLRGPALIAVGTEEAAAPGAVGAGDVVDVVLPPATPAAIRGEGEAQALPWRGDGGRAVADVALEEGTKEGRQGYGETGAIVDEARGDGEGAIDVGEELEEGEIAPRRADLGGRLTEEPAATDTVAPVAALTLDGFCQRDRGPLHFEGDPGGAVGGEEIGAPIGADRLGADLIADGVAAAGDVCFGGQVLRAFERPGAAAVAVVIEVLGAAPAASQVSPAPAAGQYDRLAPVGDVLTEGVHAAASRSGAMMTSPSM